MKQDTSAIWLASMRGMRGLSLIELMVALAIGLVVTLGIVGVMGINQQNLRITEGLSESQENARMAFELMARDVRQARDTSCGPVDSIANNLNAQWWGEWWPIRGVDGSTSIGAVSVGGDVAQRVDKTHALQLQGSGETRIISTISSNKLGLQSAAGSLNSGPVIICDLQTASLHTAAASATNEIKITPDVTVSSTDNPQFQVSRLTAVTWYIGNNGRGDEGGRSLYRVRLLPDGTTTTEEILPGVVDMQLRYHLKDGADFVNSVASKSDWNSVNAIQLTLITESTQSKITSDAQADSPLVGSDGRIRREITHVIALRNTL